MVFREATMVIFMDGQSEYFSFEAILWTEEKVIENVINLNLIINN